MSCDLCPSKFGRKCNLISHMMKHRKEKRFNCETCAKGFNYRVSYNEHLLKHELKDPRPFKCNFCSKDFTMKSLVAGHIFMKHINNIRFKCSICDRTFENRNGLRNHQVSHLKTKDFQCKICGKKFASKRYMICHQKKVHCKLQFLFSVQVNSNLYFSKFKLQVQPMPQNVQE